MTDKQHSINQSILWAAALIGSSLLLKGTDHQQDIFLLLLVLSATSILVRGKHGSSLECRLYRRLFGKGDRDDA